MRHLFSVNAEGGPLLLGDRQLVSTWRGADAADYDRLCDAYDATPGAPGFEFPLGAGTGVTWEMEGAGTADVFGRNDGTLVVIRAWLADGLGANEQADALRALAEARGSDALRIGTLRVPTGMLALLWAPESGAELPDEITADFERVAKNTAIEGSVFLVKANAPGFDCTHDEVSAGGSQARRLTLRPLPAASSATKAQA